MAQVFYSGWEGGSDYKNTGGTGVFSYGSAGSLSRNTSSPLADVADLKQDGSSIGYVMNVLSKNIMGLVCRIKLTAESLGNGERAQFFYILGPYVAPSYKYLCRAYFLDDNGTLKVQFRFYNGTAWGTIGTPITISSGTEYQVELLHNRNTKVGGKVWVANGGSQVGSTQEETVGVQDYAAGRYYVGPVSVCDASVTYQLDDFKVDDADYPGPYVSGGNAPTGGLYGPLFGPLGGPI